MNAENLARVEALCAELQRLEREAQIMAIEMQELRDRMRFALGLTPITDERQLPIAA